MPPEFRLKVQRPAGGKGGGSDKSSGKKQKSSVALSSDIKSSYNKWKKDVLAIFKIEDDALDSSDSPLAGVYVFLSRTEQRSAEDRIRRRLLYCFFNRLKKVVGDRLNKDLVKKLAMIVARSGLVPETLFLIERNIRDWIEKGAKYDNAARQCGGPGCIFLMPGPESL